jgi:hypothetical protein
MKASLLGVSSLTVVASLQPVALLDLWSWRGSWAIFRFIAILISKYFYIFRELVPV